MMCLKNSLNDGDRHVNTNVTQSIVKSKSTKIFFISKKLRQHQEKGKEDKDEHRLTDKYKHKLIRVSYGLLNLISAYYFT